MGINIINLIERKKRFEQFDIVWRGLFVIDLHFPRYPAAHFVRREIGNGIFDPIGRRNAIGICKPYNCTFRLQQSGISCSIRSRFFFGDYFVAIRNSKARWSIVIRMVIYDNYLKFFFRVCLCFQSVQTKCQPVPIIVCGNNY